MSEWRTDNPDWQDSSSITLLRAGEEINATLELADFTSDGLGDECPIWDVILPDGSKSSLWDFDAWKLRD